MHWVLERNFNREGIIESLRELISLITTGKGGYNMKQSCEGTEPPRQTEFGKSRPVGGKREVHHVNAAEIPQCLHGGISNSRRRESKPRHKAEELVSWEHSGQRHLWLGPGHIRQGTRLWAGEDHKQVNIKSSVPIPLKSLSHCDCLGSDSKKSWQTHPGDSGAKLRNSGREEQWRRKWAFTPAKLRGLGRPPGPPDETAQRLHLRGSRVRTTSRDQTVYQE